MSIQCQFRSSKAVRFRLALMGFNVGLRMAKSPAKNATMNLAVRFPVELALGLRMANSVTKLEELGLRMRQ